MAVKPIYLTVDPETRWNKAEYTYSYAINKKKQYTEEWEIHYLTLSFYPQCQLFERFRRNLISSVGNKTRPITTSQRKPREPPWQSLRRHARLSNSRVHRRITPPHHQTFLKRRGVPVSQHEELTSLCQNNCISKKSPTEYPSTTRIPALPADLNRTILHHHESCTSSIVSR